MTTAIDVTSLSYSYGASKVLKDISFSVQKGDFFIIIGPNGSGKTTLMKVIAGIAKPENGRLDVMGRPLMNYARKTLARTISFVPQMIPVEFPFTVTEMVMMGRAPHMGLLGLEQEKDIDITRRSIDFTGIKHLANRKLNQLSGGERQRVFIARAICQEPQIILLDEPTASLDLAHQVRVMDLMEKLKEEKRITIIMVSHDVNLAAMYGNSLLMLKAGQIVSMGPVNEVLTFKTLENAYGCPLLIDKNPLGKFPRITLVPQKFMSPEIRAGKAGNKKSISRTKE